MAQRKMRQQGPKPKVATRNLKARLQIKRVKTEMEKIRKDQNCIREEQCGIRTRFGEVERQCDQLKQETEMIVKQTACTQIKLVLMFNILKARETGDSVRAAMLTHFLREFVSKETAKQSSDEDDDENP